MMRVLIVTAVWAVIIVGGFFVFAAGQGEAAEFRQCGVASWYGAESGNRTANGERFDGSGMTAAHRTLPFGTVLIVVDQRTGRSVRVAVTDRGPAAWTHRILDLSRGAAQRLGIVRAGIARVCIHGLTQPR